jgi:hypothetical protein
MYDYSDQMREARQFDFESRRLSRLEGKSVDAFGFADRKAFHPLPLQVSDDASKFPGEPPAEAN